MKFSCSLELIQLLYSIKYFLKKVLRQRDYLEALSSGYLVMAVSMFVQLGLTPLYLREFGQYQFGVLMILLSFVNFAVIGIAWMSGGALRMLGEYAGRRDEESFRRAFGVIKAIYVGYGVGLAACLGCLVVWFGDVLFIGGNAVDVQAARMTLLLTGIYLIPFYAAAVDRITLTARKRQCVANLAQLAGIIVAGAGILFWLFQGGTMPGVMAFQILGALVSIGISQYLLKGDLPGLHMRVPTRMDGDLLRRLGGSTGKGFFLHGVIILMLLSDTALVGWLGGAKVAAEFFLVWKIAEVLIQLIWKLPEPLAPYFVQMDDRGDYTTMRRIASQGYVFIGIVSMIIGILYGVWGQSLVAWWVGPDNVPVTSWGYTLAGGAIFWLGISRLPIVFAGARVTLRALNRAGLFELLLKLVLTLFLFPRVGYLAILIAINFVHMLGASFLYYRLLQIVPSNTSA